MRDVYAEAEAKIRQLLLARPQARGQGKSPSSSTAPWRSGSGSCGKHGPYGARIFSACREVLRDSSARCCRAVDRGAAPNRAAQVPAPRQWSRAQMAVAEYAAFQFDLVPILRFSSSAAQSGQVG
jgi:hypothetical protein